MRSCICSMPAFTKVLRDLGYCDINEPFTNLLTQGMVIKDGSKMSKSKGNVVDPNAHRKIRADTARLFSLFAAPPEKDLDWSDQGVDGSYRFLNRVWKLVYECLPLIRATGPLDAAALTDEGKTLRRLVHKTIRKVSDDIEDRFHFNTAIAAVMEMVNAIQAFEPKNQPRNVPVLKEAVESVVLLLAPFVPHFAEELWRASAMKIISMRPPGLPLMLPLQLMKSCWWWFRSTASSAAR